MGNFVSLEFYRPLVTATQPKEGIAPDMRRRTSAHTICREIVPISMTPHDSLIRPAGQRGV
jgi:hypothetical protein